MERKEVETKYRWKTEDVFENDEAWEAAFAALEQFPDVASFRGKLNNAETVAAYFACTEAYEIKAMRVYLYAFLKHDEDVRVTKYNSYLSKVIGLMTRFEAACSFSTVELTALPEETLSAIAADPRLSEYSYVLKQMIARKPYVLSEKEEFILAQTSEPMAVAGDVFEMLDDAELNLPEIMFEGKRTKLTHGLYSVILQSGDRAQRAAVFKKYYSAYERIINTLAITYYGNVKKDIFYKTVRGYASCLDMALAQEDVSRNVYECLIDTVEKAGPIMHRYMAVRKKALGVSQMHMYDLALPLVENAELKLPFEEAYEVVIKGLAPLGEEYAALLRRGRDERWIDVCETEGKRGGAYSIGVFGNHPYVLLNYQPTTTNVFTIAHEMGHALHSYFSNEAQPSAKASYKIFVAEVASTVNEVLLLKYLLRTSEDATFKKYLLNYFMDMIRTTLFRQTQFACFEQEAHAMAERGEPLNKDNLSDLYYSLNQKFYGKSLVHDRQIAIEWARIPHFYRSFYVYKYATGITAAISIADKILREGAPAVERYFNFLKGGCSTDPVSLLQGAGADLTDPATFGAAMREFEDALNEFESLI